MKKTMSAVLSALWMSSVPAGVISVSDVTISQNSISRQVSVEYTLGDEPAIVTVDFLTNGVSIGEANFANVVGDVNRVVSVPGRHLITWKPNKSPLAGVSFAGIPVKAEVKAWPVDDPPDYMVVLCGENDVSLPRISYYVSTNALPGGLENDEYRTTKLVMRRIHAAGVRWRMGAVDSDFEGAETHEQNVVRPDETAHYVTLSEDYFIGIYEVTQEQFLQFTGEAYSGSDYLKSKTGYSMFPRHSMQYRFLRGNEAPKDSYVLGNSTKHLEVIRERTGIDFDLPTDAQWESAARGGTNTLLWSGKPYTPDNVEEIEWVYGNTPLEYDSSTGKNARYPHRVGLKPPNPYGLYDMLGNLYEICRDGYIENLGTEDVTDPMIAGTNSTQCVERGGNIQRGYTPYARTTHRQVRAVNSGTVMTGFRFACPLTLKYPVEEAAE